MSAAGFVLAINLFVAGLFATAFGIVALYYRAARGARWLALAYALGIGNAILEFSLPYQANPRPVGFGIFAVLYLALALSNVGLALHYRVKLPALLLAGLVVLGLTVNAAILDMPRESLLRALLYQAPYAAMQVFGAVLVASKRPARTLDKALVALFAFSAVYFLAKPFLAASIGSGGSPQGYLGSTYAAISQSTGAVLLISNGLLVLLIMVRDMIAEVTTRSETDPLSGLLNRRGFEDQADKARLLALRAGVPAVMLVADLDHFKLVNDSYGHEAGDKVIAAFGNALRRGFAARAVIGRLGGEEFAVMLPGASMAAAHDVVEAVRLHLRDMSAQERGIERAVTGSFGIAALEPDDSLADLLRRADRALYEAKAQGRDRIALAPQPVSMAKAEGHGLSGPAPD